MPKKPRKDEPKEVTRDDMVKAIMAPMRDAFDGQGITPEYLAKKLKRELNATENKIFYNKDVEPGILLCSACNGGGIDPKNPTTPKGKPRKCKICKGVGSVQVTGVIYSDDLVAWDIRQKARQDAHKLMGDYPAEKKDITSGGRPIINMSDIPDEVLRKLAGN